MSRGFVGRVTIIFMNRDHKFIYENVARILESRAEDDLLEAACRNGYFLKKCASHVHTVAGLDLSGLMVKITIKKNKERATEGTAEIVQGDASQLPWKNNRFSVATIMDSFLGNYPG